MLLGYCSVLASEWPGSSGGREQGRVYGVGMVLIGVTELCCDRITEERERLSVMAHR